MENKEIKDSSILILPEFGLINMNARIYDPLLGRFLSPDPFVQAPDFSQSFNRYSYCLNNPFKYTDPSGNKWWHWLTGVLADVVTGGGYSLSLVNSMVTTMAVDFTRMFITSGHFSDIDPTASWSLTNKQWKINAGLYAYDPHKKSGGQFWEVFSRHTWQSFQSGIGHAMSSIQNLFYGVNRVDYYGGATTVTFYSKYAYGQLGVTLGSFILGGNGLKADPNESTFQHEYGHYLQSQRSGIFYFQRYAIPSAFNGKGDPMYHPVEQDANIRAFKYFNRYVENYNGWDFNNSDVPNKINGYNPNLPYDDPVNQQALSHVVRLSWYDYVLGPNIFINGLINSLILNEQ
jgi:RHS repeat-associated protein